MKKALKLIIIFLPLFAAGIWVFYREKLPRIEPAETCRNSYERFFANEEIDLRIVFGYKDARPARFVGDRYERNYLTELLLKPCTANRQDCGFSRDEEDSDLLLKTVVGPTGAKKLVKLQLAASSAGPDDEENLADRFQNWKSRRASQIFYWGLRKSDAVFYNGHSREGGGPDFYTPRLDSKGAIDYGWYKKLKTGKDLISRNILRGKNSVKLVGLYSCVSNEITPKSTSNSRTAWITYSKLLYFSDALQGLRDSLSALLNAECKDEFHKALTINNTYSQLTGFF